MSSEALQILAQSLGKLANDAFAEKLNKELKARSASTAKTRLSETHRTKLDAEVHYITKAATTKFFNEFIVEYEIHTSPGEFEKELEILWNAILKSSTNYYKTDNNTKIYLIDFSKIQASTDKQAILNFIFQDPPGSVILTEERYKKLKAASTGFNGVDALFKNAFSTISPEPDSLLFEFLHAGYDIGHYGANITHLTSTFTIGALLTAGKDNAKILNELLQDNSSKDLIRDAYKNILMSESGRAVFKSELFNLLYEHEMELIRNISSDNSYAKLNLKFNAGSAQIKTIVDKILLNLKNSGVEVGPQNSELNQSIGSEIERMVRAHLPKFYKAIEQVLQQQASSGKLTLEKLKGSDSLEDLIHKKLKADIKGTTPPNTPIISKVDVKSIKKSSEKFLKPIGTKTGTKRTSTSTGNLTSLRNLRGQFTSLVKLETLIRSLLLETIQKNMQRPNLRNQTGRFAESVKLDRLQRERDGSLTAFLSYMKYPYATFEKGGRQGFRGYYPSRLLDQSAREIATKLVTARLKTVIV